MRRSLLHLPALAAVLAITACGRAAPGAAGTVHLALDGPSDGSRVSAGTVTVTGRVSPAGAHVIVMGRPASVDAGRFRARVDLQPGLNLIDVLAGAPRERAAMVALRVMRFDLVTVPDLTGQDPAAAADRLAADGLQVHLAGGSPLTTLLPIAAQVCSTAPPAGRRVAPGATVTVEVGTFC